MRYSGHRWSVGDAPEEGAPMGANELSGYLREPYEEDLMSLSFGGGDFGEAASNWSEATFAAW